MAFIPQGLSVGGAWVGGDSPGRVHDTRSGGSGVPSVFATVSAVPAYPNRREYLHASMGERHSAIASIGNLKAADIRAKAMLLLFSIYELRSGEVRRLMLEDIDWRSVEAGCVSFDMPLLSSENNSGIEKRDEH